MDDQLINKNINKYLIYVAFSRALFYLPIFVIFYNELGISYGIVMIFFTILSIIKFLLEVPSGAFADNVGRKKTICISILFKIASLAVLTLLAILYHKINIIGYILIIISTLFFGIGEVLESGTSDALIYDYLKFYNKQDFYKEVAAKGNSLIFIVFSVSGAIGSILYSINRSLPYLFTLIAFSVCLISILSFDELNLKEKNEKDVKLFKSVFNTIGESINEVKNVKYLANILVYGGFLFSFFMLIIWQLQIYFKAIDINIAWLGTIFAALSLVSSLSSRLYPYIEKKVGLKRSFIIVPILLGILFISLKFSDNIYIIFLFVMMIYMLWGYSIPFYGSLLNDIIDSETRATTISIQSLIKSVIYGILSPISGFLIDRYDIKTTFSIFGVLILLSFSLLMLPMILNKNKYKESPNQSSIFSK